MRLAICDDEQNICFELENILAEILNSLKIKYEVEIHFSGKELCKKIELGVNYDLIFLDVKFANDEISGVEVGTQIRNFYEQDTVAIVFISWEMKHSMKLFDIRPFNFLIKPLEYDKIKQVVETYIKLHSLRASDFVYKIRHDIFRVNIKDIIYVESIHRKLILHLSDGRKHTFYGTLKEAYQEQLHKFDFLFIHASYTVNYDYISSFKHDSVILSYENISLPISRQKKREVKENYIAIMERRGVM